MRNFITAASLIACAFMPLSASADDGHEPFMEFAKETLYRIVAGQEPTRLAYTGTSESSIDAKPLKNKSFGYVVCDSPEPTGCRIDRNPSFYTHDYMLLTWKAFVKRRVGISDPTVIGIIFDPINQSVIVYYTYIK